MMEKLRSKIGQEEMVGFAIIMIIVFVIMLVFLGFSMSNSDKEAVESYEAQSFLQSMLAYTTSCDDHKEVYLKTRDLIFKCDSNKTCVNGNSSCEILVTTLRGILMESWNVEGNSSIKGYSLKIGSEGKELVSLERGNVTRNSKGAGEGLPRGGKTIEVSFVAYY